MALVTIAVGIALIWTLTADKAYGHYNEYIHSPEATSAPSQTAPSCEIPPSETPPPEEESPADPHTQVDFPALLAINPDTVGWISIPGTPVRYPVVQGRSNSDYLKKSFEGKKHRYGSIFMDYRLAADSEVTIIYGHNMGKGSEVMFSSLTGYLKEDYYESHPVIEYNTLDTNAYWEIFAVCVVDVADAETVADIYRLGWTDRADYDGYIQQLKTNALYDTGITPEYAQRLLLLSTCRGLGRKTERILVVAAELPADP